MVPIFLINLDRAKDRLEFMRRQSERAGITFERIPGVDGASVPPWLRDKFLSPSGSIASNLFPGEVGCYASHLCVFKALVERRLPVALVLEDDVELKPDFCECLSVLITSLPAGWDIIKLNNNPQRAVYSVGTVNWRHLVRFSRHPGRTGGYLISQSGALKMLKPGLRTHPVDIDFNQPWRFGLDVYAVCPAPLTQLKTLGSAVKDQGRRGFVPKDKTHGLRAALYAMRTIGPLGLLQCRAAEIVDSIRQGRSRPLIVQSLFRPAPQRPIERPRRTEAGT